MTQRLVEKTLHTFAHFRLYRLTTELCQQLAQVNKIAHKQLITIYILYIITLIIIYVI